MTRTEQSNVGHVGSWRAVCVCVSCSKRRVSGCHVVGDEVVLLPLDGWEEKMCQYWAFYELSLVGLL